MKNIPEWAKKPFNDLLEQVNTLRQSEELIKRGINALTEIPNTIDAIINQIEINEYTDGNHIKENIPKFDKDEIRKIASLAKNERENDFSLFNQQSLIMLWSYLEAAVGSCVTNYLVKDKSIFNNKDIYNLKISIGEYYESEEYCLFSAYEKTICNGFSYGPERLEILLKPIGLNGYIDPNIKRNLLEMAQIRNCILHKSGKCDVRLKDLVPG